MRSFWLAAPGSNNKLPRQVSEPAFYAVYAVYAVLCMSFKAVSTNTRGLGNGPPPPPSGPPRQKTLFLFFDKLPSK